MHHQRRPAIQQFRIYSGGHLGRPANVIAQRQPAQAELLAVIGVDGHRHFHSAETFIARAKHHGQLVLARSYFELILVMERLFLKLFHFFLAIQIKVHSIAEPGGDRAIRLVGNAEHVDS